MALIAQAEGDTGGDTTGGVITTEGCTEGAGQVCDLVLQQTNSEFWADLTNWVVDRPLRIVIVLLLAWGLNRILRRSVRRLGERLSARSEQEIVRLERQREHGTALNVAGDGRGHQRTKTLTSVISSLVTALIWTIASLLMLGQIGISVAPLIAGAGVLGLVLGFGAQKIVADFLAGVFMLIEDQFGVGDIVDLGDVSGTVEKVSLRVTTVRDLTGNLWHVPNSGIERVANMSQIWSRAVLDIEVAYDTDLRRAEGIIQRVADDLWQDKDFNGGDIIDPPQVWGIERLGADGVAIRLVVKTDPAEQFGIARELRLRIKEAFDEAGIEIPFPQRTVWIRQDNSTPRDERPVVDVAPPRPSTIADEPPG